MSDFKFTNYWAGLGQDFSSTAVDNVWYNANERFAVIDWDDTLYRYDNVDLSDVERVVNAPSVGTAAASLKKSKGPGTKLGTFYDLDWEKVAPVKSTVTATKEFNLQAPAVSAKNGGLSAGKVTSYRLHFDLDGKERTHTITGKETLGEALDTLHDHAAALGVAINVKGAWVEFGD